MSTSTTTESGPPPSATASDVASRAWDRARTGPALVLLLTVACFWPSVWSFTNTWGRYNYAHGWLVPPLVAWLIWSGRADFRDARGGDSSLLLAIVGLSLFWLASTIMHIQLFHQTAFVLLMVCWGLFVFGRRGAQTVLMAGLVTLLSLPVWEVFLPVLRRLASVMSGGMVKALGIPVDISGNMIHLQAGSLEVGDDCAGLNYLLSALVIGIVYAQAMLRDKRSRLMVVAVAAATAIASNWVRIAVIAVVAHVSEMQAWLIKNHIEFGWVVFAFSLLVFFRIARVIEGRAERSAGDAEREATTSAGGPSLQARETRDTESTDPIKRMAVASCVAIVGPALFFAFAALPDVEVEAAGLEEISAGAGWNAIDRAAERPFEWSPQYQGAQQHHRQTFTNGSTFVYADRFVYREQAQNAKLIGWPNRIAHSRNIVDERIVGPVDPAGRRWVRQAVVGPPAGPVLVWYWYRVGGVNTATPVHAKALEVPAFLTRRRSSELIAFSAACEPESCVNAFETLTDFMGIQRPADGPQPSGGGSPTGP